MTPKFMKTMAFVALLGAAATALAAGLLDVSYRPLAGKAPVNLKERYAGVQWGRDDTAIVNSRWFNTRHETRTLVDPSNPGAGRVLVVERPGERDDADPHAEVSRMT